MRINLTKEFRNNKNLLGNLILHGITYATTENLPHIIASKHEKGSGDLHADVVITVDGYEINLESFVKHWQSQVSRIIKSEAKELIQAKFFDVNDLLDDLERRVQEEVDKRLEDWEKEELS